MGARRPVCEDMTELVTLRILGGYTQQDLADHIGLSQATVANIEAGTASLTTTFARSYAGFFGKDVKLAVVPKQTAPGKE